MLGYGWREYFGKLVAHWFTRAKHTIQIPLPLTVLTPTNLILFICYYNLTAKLYKKTEKKRRKYDEVSIIWSVKKIIKLTRFILFILRIGYIYIFKWGRFFFAVEQTNTKTLGTNKFQKLIKYTIYKTCPNSKDNLNLYN